MDTSLYNYITIISNYTLRRERDGENTRYLGIRIREEECSRDTLRAHATEIEMREGISGAGAQG